MVFPDGEHWNNFLISVILLKVLKKRFIKTTIQNSTLDSRKNSLGFAEKIQ